MGFDFLFPVLYAVVYTVFGICLQLAFFPIGDINIESDFYGDLVIAAQNLAAGRFSVNDFPFKGPLYAFALTPARWIAGEWYRGAVVLSALSAGLFLLLAYRLTLRLFDRRTAVLSMLTASLVVEFFMLSHRAVTDVLFLLLSLGSMACTVLPGGSLRRHAAAGWLAGLAFLTRYNGVALVCGGALVLALVNPDSLARRQRLKALALYLGAFLFVCAPWFLANWRETGSLLATRNVQNVVAAFFGATRWQGDPTVESQSLPALVSRDPVYIATRYAANLTEHASKILSQLLGWPMALFPLAGSLGFAIRPPTRRQTALYVFAVAYWLCMGIVFYASRFFLPLVLPSLAAGFSLVRRGSAGTSRLGAGLQRWVQARGRRRIALSVLSTFLLVLAVVQVRRIGASERKLYGGRPLYILEAAPVLARQASASRPRLLARKGHMAYYAGFDYTPYSTKVRSLEELVGLARSVNAEYIVHSSIEYLLLPHLLFLAVADTVPLLHEVYRGRNIRIFRLADDTRTTLSDTEKLGLLRANLRGAQAQRHPWALFTACDDLARYHLQKQEFAAAAQRFQQALEVARGAMHPEMQYIASDARYNLAGALLGLGRAEAAIPILRENVEYLAARGVPHALALNHQRLGVAYGMLGREEEARREQRLARELYPAGATAAGSESLQAQPRPE